MRCEICGAEGQAVLKVVHRVLGPRKICIECYNREIDNLVQLRRCCQ